MRATPLKNTWHEEKPWAGKIKEVSGKKALFHWHCGVRMRKVIIFQKTDKGIRRLGYSGWFCETCGKRKPWGIETDE